MPERLDASRETLNGAAFRWRTRRQIPLQEEASQRLTFARSWRRETQKGISISDLTMSSPSRRVKWCTSSAKLANPEVSQCTRTAAFLFCRQFQWRAA